MSIYKKGFGSRDAHDPVPHELHTGTRAAESLKEVIQRYVRNEISKAAQDRGSESFEEADDFEIEDGEEFHSPFEDRHRQRPKEAVDAGNPASSAVQSAPKPLPAEPEKPASPAEQ